MTRPNLPLAPLAVSLVRHVGPGYYGKPICHPADVYELLREEAMTWDRERFLSLALDAGSRPLGLDTVSIGILNTCQLHPREVMKTLILANAAAFIVLHNHPSGSPAPSPEDHAVTRKLRDVGELLGIPLHDHIILAPPAGYYSFVEHGDL